MIISQRAARMLLSCCTLLALLLIPLTAIAESRTWTDSTGQYSIQATLLSIGADAVVLEVDKASNAMSHDLVAIPIDRLSDKDREFLKSKEAAAAQGEMDKDQAWTMRDGTLIAGKVVDFVRKDVTIQRRRGRVFVNDQLLTNLPEIYRNFIPKIVAHFENIQLPDDRAFNEWMVRQRATPRTFRVEGVIMELENQDEFAVPFFLFSDEDLKVLQPGWDRWVATMDEHEQRQRESFYLQSRAMAYKRDRQAAHEMAMMQLGLLAVNAGVTSLWEVTLEPGPWVRGYPQVVIVPGRNSEEAAVAAMQQFPGFNRGPIRRISRR